METEIVKDTVNTTQTKATKVTKSSKINTKADDTVTAKSTSKKKYEPTDGIECKSITSGELGMIGIKSNILYRWAGRDDVTEVEYQDLVAGIRSSSDSIMKPRFIILDNEFVQEFPALQKVYENLYSIKDLKDVLKLPVSSMKKTIQSLPDGAKESIKSIAAGQIRSGQLDSVNKIKALDELFDVKFILMTNLVD